VQILDWKDPVPAAPLILCSWSAPLHTVIGEKVAVLPPCPGAKSLLEEEVPLC